jgi:hypothetical protein
LVHHEELARARPEGATIATGQSFSDNDLRAAAGEMAKLCHDPRPPPFAMEIFSRLFNVETPLPVKPARLEIGDQLMEEMDEFINDGLDINEGIETPKLVPNTGRTPILAPALPPGWNCPLVEQFLRDPSIKGRPCNDPTCMMGSEFMINLLATDNLAPDKPNFAHVTFADAGSRSKLGEGPHDLRYDAGRTMWHLDELGDLPGILAQMTDRGFVESIEGHGYMTLKTQDYILGDLGPNHKGHQKGKSSETVNNPNRTFTAVSFGAPNGTVLIVHCNYDGIPIKAEKYLY